MGSIGLYRSRLLAASRHLPSLGSLAALCLSLLAAGPVVGAPSCADIGAKAPETRCEELRFGGRARTFRIYVPTHLAEAVPVLFVLHGGGGGGAGMEELTQHGFNRRADEAGAIVVYPDGVGHGWNDGRTDVNSRSAKEDVDDVGFMRALVAALELRFRVDPARVVVTGMSNGGMMTLRLACEARDVFKGFVAVAASLGADVAPGCDAAGITRLALIDGTADPIVPWAGGTVSVAGWTRGRVIGARATFDHFMAAAKCGAEQDEPPLDRVADDGTQLTLHRAAGCQGGADLRLYEIDGGGHTWPGGSLYARERFIGKVSRELDATDETWRFLGLAPGNSPGPV
jgi:polyhydroxybutyrate depolymerase